MDEQHNCAEKDRVCLHSDCDIVLTEDDIPGTKLYKPVEQCSMAILKRWLSCRGANITGKKLELVNRVKNYINNGLDGQVVDPDSGKNYRKKRITLSTPQTTPDEAFPMSGFQTDLSILPRVRYANIWKFLIDDVEVKKQVSTEKPLVKGYNFFKSGNVQHVLSQTRNGLYFIKSKVLPSMKKDSYIVKITMNERSLVQKAFCDCPAGIDGRCNHVAATLFLLESLDCSLNKVNNFGLQNSVTPCTSKPCTWNIPKRAAKASTIQDMKFIKHSYNKEKFKSAEHILIKKIPEKQKPSNEDLHSFYKKIKILEAETGMKTGLSFIIPKPNDENNFGTSETSDYNPSYSAHLDGTSMQLVSPNKYLPMSLNEIKARSERVKKRLLASVSDRDRIMELTVNQHESKLWYDVRQPRIIASKVKRGLIKPTISPTNTNNYHTPIQTKAMKDGIESEAGILKKYELISGNTVRKV
ncbi:uncharacterized protein LOC124458362 [Xenia sp. Carnegie-2017]|uniref:uncharacterized protein LOC124458362 n=1 Tax=Xenia sp. Carnegie-2017 TaxID=2897299 RepID=UPI001F03D4B2|nr:uncharacterized protein LOC124458362 [Xenia sp. Carnegie-2017]